jgi:hypothetical protein
MNGYLMDINGYEWIIMDMNGDLIDI